MPQPSSIVTFRDRARARSLSRLRENVRQAALLADPAEAEILDQLVGRVGRDELGIDEANDTVLAIRHGQLDRQARAA